MKPSPNDIHNALRSIENAERGEEHPRTLARKAVAQHRSLSHGLTQAQIDQGVDNEGRRQRFVSSAVKWSRRSWWARLLR